ncbi:hypothetical protein CROQUDRAFT_94796 [Cronartium quercuum f. sp. fusiforme G11]|uniref:Uncharacterized protein n=1 Tax=Cronartium quercuum f. sp. fusiforme G11 TaxID=708437 RepID=A0A9P6NI85_9BASI|nr:hypothetical protein CROQUDRAFT_94796 [Cronartium quercuum f. sp. fusiforme G11]
MNIAAKGLAGTEEEGMKPKDAKMCLAQWKILKHWAQDVDLLKNKSGAQLNHKTYQVNFSNELWAEIKACKQGANS